MYNAIIPGAKTEEEVIEAYGVTIVDNLLDNNCHFSGRVIDDCYEVDEMEASVIINDDITLTVHFLIQKEDTKNCEDMSDFNYANYYFTIN